MLPVTFAIIAVVFTAILRVYFKRLSNAGTNTYALLCVYQFLTASLFLPFIDFAQILNASATTLGLLSLNCLIWYVAVVLDLKAYDYLDAATAEVYGTLTLLVSVAAAYFFCAEALSLPCILGIAIVISSAFYAAKNISFDSKKGIILRLSSALLVALATFVDRKLCAEISPPVIAFFSFLVPAFFYTIPAIKSGQLRNIHHIPEFNKLLVLPVLGALGYYLWLLALAQGSVVMTITIGQTCIAFIFIIEYLLGQLRENMFQRFLPCATCCVGAMVVCLY